jgi:tyrosyl-tRNA synthetase
VCITLPILEGTDGIEKMSKSLDNYIGISDSAEDMYGKTLSIRDELIYRYFVLATDLAAEDLPAMKTFAAQNPRDAKHQLAHALVRIYHGEDAADAARQHFETVFIRKENPDELPEFVPDVGDEPDIGLLDLIRQAGFAQSNGEARRLVQQNAVSIDGEKAIDPGRRIDLDEMGSMILKVGKRRIARIRAR